MFKNYSVVMSVYCKDEPEWLRLAIDSMLNQSVASDDIIIIADGPLTNNLNVTLNEYRKINTINIFRLQKNRGLAYALNYGIAKSKYNLIARMDADDIAVPNRCELQLSEFNSNPGLDILGGQIAEFDHNPNEILYYRKVPISSDEISKFARRRSPFNHPTVMFKKEAIESAGGYDISANRIEDYDLWLRSIARGAVCGNLKEVLIKYRSNKDTMKRRKTFISYKNQIAARKRFLIKKYISFFDFIFGIATQTLLFILPIEIASYLFNKLVRNEDG